MPVAMKAQMRWAPYFIMEGPGMKYKKWVRRRIIMHYEIGGWGITDSSVFLENKEIVNEGVRGRWVLRHEGPGGQRLR